MKSAPLIVLVVGLFALPLAGCGSSPKAAASADADSKVCEVCAASEYCPECAAKKGMGDKEALASIVKPIQQAHHKQAYGQHDAVKADLDVDFGGEDMLEGTMWFTADVGKVRMELTDGTVVVWDGQTCWVSPADAQVPPGARFHALTWPYFMAAPFKLSDPGTHHADAGEQPLTANATAPASKLTFGEGVGDAPDDWYLVFKSPVDQSLLAMAYIVTYGKDAAEAEKDPHLIFYRNPTTVDGVVFAQQWVFHNWSPDTGINGDAIGRASLRNIAFITPPAGAFDKPEGAAEAPLPDAK